MLIKKGRWWSCVQESRDVISASTFQGRAWFCTGPLPSLGRVPLSQYMGKLLLQSNSFQKSPFFLG